MPFSFTQVGGDEDRARADLDEAIAVLVARPAVDAELAEATAAVGTRFTDEAFERQVALVRERQALEARLANLMLDDKDGENLE
jgi:DNA primase